MVRLHNAMYAQMSHPNSDVMIALRKIAFMATLCSDDCASRKVPECKCARLWFEPGALHIKDFDACAIYGT